MTQENNRQGHGMQGLIPGLIVAGIGLLFLLNNLNILDTGAWWRYWPAIIIAAGLVKLVDAQSSGERTAGAIIMGVGGILLVSSLRLMRLGWGELWPLFLIGTGLLMLWNRTAGKLVIGVKLPRTAAVTSGFAIFGGLQRQITTDDFQGGNFFAIFGGGEIDLRRAGIRGDSALLEINAIFGGFEVKVPQNWMVVNEVVGVFGGTGDETMQPNRDMPGVKQLILRGTAIFGGVGIKN
jgi:hypothetical protein